MKCRNLLLIPTLICVFACTSREVNLEPNKPSYLNPESPLEAFIEISAGSNIMMSYDLESGELDTIRVNAKPRVLEYLPYPANSGFLLTEKDGQDLKLPVWILCQRLNPGEIVEITMLGLLDYTEERVQKSVWLAVPKDETLKTVDATDFKDFIIRYDPVKFMLEYWIKNLNGIGKVSQIVWHDGETAMYRLQDN